MNANTGRSYTLPQDPMKRLTFSRASTECGPHQTITNVSKLCTKAVVSKSTHLSAGRMARASSVLNRPVLKGSLRTKLTQYRKVACVARKAVLAEKKNETRMKRPQGGGDVPSETDGMGDIEQKKELPEPWDARRRKSEKKKIVRRAIFGSFSAAARHWAAVEPHSQHICNACEGVFKTCARWGKSFFFNSLDSQEKTRFSHRDKSQVLIEAKAELPMVKNKKFEVEKFSLVVARALSAAAREWICGPILPWINPCVLSLIYPLIHHFTPLPLLSRPYPFPENRLARR